MRKLINAIRKMKIANEGLHGFFIGHNRACDDIIELIKKYERNKKLKNRA
jgi:hypothetical protein